MIEVKGPPLGGDPDYNNPTSSESALQAPGHPRDTTTQILTPEQLKTIAIFDNFIDYKFSISTPDIIISGLTAKETSQQLVSAKTIALGDIHGSYEKLVETLITSRLATMPPDKAERFIEISAEFEDLVAKNPHLAEPLVRAKAKEIEAELGEIIETITWIGGDDKQLILLGDILADRGVTDTLTLKLLNRLSSENPGQFIKLT
jgi:hypothetical protein